MYFRKLKLRLERRAVEDRKMGGWPRGRAECSLERKAEERLGQGRKTPGPGRPSPPTHPSLPEYNSVPFWHLSCF